MNFFSNLLDAPIPGQNLSGSFLHFFDILTPDHVRDLVKNQGAPRVILNDHHTLSDTLPAGIKGLFLPLFAAQEARLWKKSDFVQRLPQTLSTFCVMANKKNLTRSLCLRMIEIMQFDNFVYSWSGLGRSTDMSLVIAELDWLGDRSPLSMQQKGQLLSAIKMPANIVGHTRPIEDIALAYHGALGAWQEGLDQMFFQSAVSVITETYTHSKEAVFTEKTIYAMLGLTFPIWVGGFGQAKVWSSFGFDIFDDIIDHSYQFKATLIERCWYALELNKKILKDFKLAKQLRESRADRLMANRDLVLSDRLFDYSQQVIDDMPAEYRTHVLRSMDLVKNYEGQIKSSS